MAEAEPTGASGGLQALNSGSGLYKLVKLGHAEATYAPTDIEVARIEAQFTGPDLRDAEKELLQIAGSEETERKALLDRCAQYDAILDHLNAKTGDAKPAKDTSDVHTTSTHGMDFAQQVRHARAPPAPARANRPSVSRTKRRRDMVFRPQRTTLRARNAPRSRTPGAAINSGAARAFGDPRGELTFASSHRQTRRPLPASTPPTARLAREPRSFVQVRLDSARMLWVFTHTPIFPK